MTQLTTLRVTREDAPVRHLKPQVPASTFTWRELRRDEFWRSIAAWRDIDAATFLDHRWQEKNAVTSSRGLVRLLGDRLSPEFIADLEEGTSRAPMSMRVSPYILALTNWDDPLHDPLRRQFLPLASQLEEDHPLLMLDSLAEQADSPVPGISHRYFDRALFLTTDQCPVYCRFCTRSYAVGLDTDAVTKVAYPVDTRRWQRVFQYVSERVELEEIIISGGDVYRLKPEHLKAIGHRLLDIPHIRRMRFATKGLAIQPMKILSDPEWTAAITEVAARGRALHKDVSIHTHFNHPNEFTGITEDALGVFFERGIPVRNLTVLMKGVNDSDAIQLELTRRLMRVNIRPYYTYMSDLVSGVEDLRTALFEAMAIEKVVRGAVSGHNVPTYVLDAPGGGGKRNLFSYEHYDRETGISVYSAPSVKPGQLFVYGDPLRYLSEDIRRRWRDESARREMIEDALSVCRVSAPDRRRQS